MNLESSRLRFLYVAALLALVGFAACGGGPSSSEPPSGERATASVPGQQNQGPLKYPKWQTVEPGEYTSYNRRLNLVQRGQDVYNQQCLGCHGELGDGRGVAAARLITQPRDFTRGLYKFRSTTSESLPMESDLYRTITRGLAGVSMPAFPLMTHRDKLSVIEYIKTFYPGWDDEKNQRILVPVPRAPTDLSDGQRILRGRFVYLDMQCNQCHGVDGQGTQATRTEFVDSWGNPQKAFNFARGSLKGGDSPEDVYRTFHTGLASIMPSYGGTILAGVSQERFQELRDIVAPEEFSQLAAIIGGFPARASDVASMSEAEQQERALRNSWDLVSYILSLRQKVTTAQAVLGESE